MLQEGKQLDLFVENGMLSAYQQAQLDEELLRFVKLKEDSKNTFYNKLSILSEAGFVKGKDFDYTEPKLITTAVTFSIFPDEEARKNWRRTLEAKGEATYYQEGSMHLLLNTIKEGKIVKNTYSMWWEQNKLQSELIMGHYRRVLPKTFLTNLRRYNKNVEIKLQNQKKLKSLVELKTKELQEKYPNATVEYKVDTTYYPGRRSSIKSDVFVITFEDKSEVTLVLEKNYNMEFLNFYIRSFKDSRTKDLKELELVDYFYNRQ